MHIYPYELFDCFPFRSFTNDVAMLIYLLISIYFRSPEKDQEDMLYSGGCWLHVHEFSSALFQVRAWIQDRACAMARINQVSELLRYGF